MEACAKTHQELPPKAPPQAKPLLPLPDQGKQSLVAKVKQLLEKEHPRPIVLSKLVAMVIKNATEPDNDPMSVHVGNVSGDTTHESLENKFAEFGTVKCVNLKDTSRGRYAFVEFTSADSQERAIDASRDAGISVDNRKLKVTALSSTTTASNPSLGFQPSAKVWFEQRADEFQLKDCGSGVFLVRLQRASTGAVAQGQKKRRRSDPDDESARPADTDAVNQVTRVLLSQAPGRHGPSMRLSDLLKALDCCHLKPTPEAWLGRHEDKFQMKALSSSQGRLYISNISTEHRARAKLAPDTALQSVFETFGKIKNISFGAGNRGKEKSSQSPTIAFVEFFKPRHAEMALDAASKDPGIRFGGQKLHVQKARNTPHHETIVSLVEGRGEGGGGGGGRASKKRRSELSAAGTLDHGDDDPLKLQRLKDGVAAAGGTAAGQGVDSSSRSSGGGRGSVTTGATAEATKPRKPKPMCETPGWTVDWSSEHNEWFFRNMQTKESTWVAPGSDDGFSWMLGRVLEVSSKGFAFIAELSRDLMKTRIRKHFCHQTIPHFRQLVEGQLIEFKLRQSTKKKGKTEVGELRAARVQVSE